MERPRISAIVICFNEEERIGDCLESVSWCDEIVAVDSHSGDRTRNIVARYTDRIFVRDWPGYREQKQFALEQARYDWVLNVDADERVSPELRRAMEEALADGAPGVNGFYVPRLVYYLGRWWHRGGWYPDYRLRLFRREKSRWGGTNPHEKVVVDGPTGRLRGHLLHFTYGSIAEHLVTVNKLTDISAAEVVKKGRPSPGSLTLRPGWRFFRSLVLNRGILEGWAGYFVAVTAAFYVFLKYAKSRELCRPDRSVGAP